MPRRERRRSSIRAVAIFLTLLAALAGYFVVRSAIAAVAGSGATLMMRPVDYTDLMKALANTALDPQLRVTPAMAQLSAEAAKRSPLNHEPYFVAALARQQAGEGETAINLLEHARRRKSNHLGTRLHLLQLYEKRGRHAEALAELDVFLRLSPEAKRLVLPELVKQLPNPKARTALAQALAREPSWRIDFLKAAQAEKVKPQDALELLRDVKKTKRGGDTQPEEEFVINSLFNSGMAGQARDIWLMHLGRNYKGGSELLFNGNFQSGPVGGPFDWKFYDEAVGRAEISRSKGEEPYLEVFFYGGRTIKLAEQALALKPGRYRIQTSAKSDSGVSSGRLLWRVTCLQSGQIPTELGLERLSSRYSDNNQAFSIPATGCPAQTLSLIAEPGDLARAADAQFSKVGITRGN